MCIKYYFIIICVTLNDIITITIALDCGPFSRKHLTKNLPKTAYNKRVARFRLSRNDSTKGIVPIVQSQHR